MTNIKKHFVKKDMNQEVKEGKPKIKQEISEARRQKVKASKK